jgi:hypothetical protein
VTVLIVSWILTLLSVFSLTFNREIRGDLRLSRLESEKVRSFAMARSGAALAGALLARSAGNEWDAPVEGWEHNPLLRSVELPEGFFSVGHRPDPDRDAVYGIEDEGRRIPLHLLDEDVLGRLPDIPADAIERILAWARSATDGEFPDPAALAGLEEAARRSLQAHVTPYPVSGVNINTASPIVLAAIGIPDEAVGRIVAHRDGRDGRPGTSDDSPLTSLLVPDGGLDEIRLDAEEAAVLSIKAREEELVVRSSVFRLRARGWLAGARAFAEIEAVVERSASGSLEVLDWRETWRS